MLNVNHCMNERNQTIYTKWRPAYWRRWQFRVWTWAKLKTLSMQTNKTKKKKPSEADKIQKSNLHWLHWNSAFVRSVYVRSHLSLVEKLHSNHLYRLHKSWQQDQIFRAHPNVISHENLCNLQLACPLPRVCYSTKCTIR